MGKRLQSALVVLLIVFGSSAYFLRGSFAPTGQFEAYSFDRSQLNPYSFQTVGNASLPAGGFQSVQTAQAVNVTVAGSRMTGMFPAGKTPLAAIFQENLTADAQKYPLFHATIESSPAYSSTGGFAFGIRFLARLNNSQLVMLQNDSFPLEHVKSGGVQSLTVNLQNYGFNVTGILAAQLYVEERPGISSNFSVAVSSLSASRIARVPYCSSGLCFVTLSVNGTNGILDALVADVNYTGDSTYQLGFSNQNQLYLSSSYGDGTSHAAISSDSQREPLGSVPSIPNTLYIITNATHDAVTLDDVKVTFTGTPTETAGTPVPGWLSYSLVMTELSAAIFVPALLLASRGNWRILLGAGVALRLVLMPWTGHPSDTPLLIRTSYLYYHQGWNPLFYNPPTLFALSIPVGFMQFYYLLGLDRIDQMFLFHFGGAIATLFVKLPFLILDVATALVLSRLSAKKEISMVFLLNPFSIFVSAVWGQYESVTVFFLLVGYALATRAKTGLGYLAGLAGFLGGALVELFGFLVAPLYVVFLALRRQLIPLALTVAATAIILSFPNTLSAYFLSLSLSNPILQPGLYSLSAALNVSSQFPFLLALSASIIYAFYSLLRTGSFVATIPGVAAAIVSFELFAQNHPQLMLIPLGIIFLYFLLSGDDFFVTDDYGGAYFVWFCGAVITLVTIVGTQSFAYLLTGEGYWIFPAIEGGNHLSFYSVTLLVTSVALLARTRKRFPLVRTGLVVAMLVVVVWYLVNYLWI